MREEEAKPDKDAELIGELLDDLSQNLQKIAHHGGRASSIVKGMLEHSRTSTGERQSTNLNALADEYLRLAYQGMRAKDKTFNAQLLTDLTPIWPGSGSAPGNRPGAAESVQQRLLCRAAKAENGPGGLQANRHGKDPAYSD